MPQLKGMSDWTQVGEILVRHRGGKIYLRAKVNGKVIRISLGITDLRIAKIMRDDRLAGIRKATVKNPSTTNVRTVGEAVAVAVAVNPVSLNTKRWLSGNWNREWTPMNANF